MGKETATIEHTCNVVRRQVHEEFPDLTLHFIICRKDGKRKHDGIGDHPAGALLLPIVKKADPKDIICVIGRAKEKKLLSFMAREKTLACILLATDETDGERLRQLAYAMAWHVLNAIIGEDKKTSAEKIITVRYQDETDLAWHNMLADSFAALAMEIQKKKGAIRALAKRRCTMALEAVPGYAAEHYPYPIVMDGAQLIYDDARKENALSKSRPFTQALEMTREIGVSFDKTTVPQWWAFCRPAQDMAWLNIEKNKILGAAIHSSDDPYARSTAYLLAETLTLDPAVVSNISLYDAFTDPEVNERHHKKICEDLFQNLISSVAMQGDAQFFRTEAAKQNQKLLEGQVVGWCAPGLIAAANEFDMAPEGGEKIEAAKKAFAAFQQTIGSETVRKLAHAVIATRRSGDATPERLAALFNEDPNLQNYAHAVK